MLSRLSLPGLAALGAVTIWGTSFPAASVALESFSPGALACVRFVLSSLILGVIMVLKREPLPSFVITIQVACVGFVGIGFTQICISFGLTFSTSGDAAFIVATSPIFVVLFSYLFRPSKPSRSSVFAIIIGGIGLLIVILQSGFEIGMIGLLSIALASIALAAYTVLNPKYLSDYGENSISSLQFLAVAMWSSTIVFLVFFGGQAFAQLPTATPAALHATVFLAVLSGVLAYWLFSYALAYQHPIATSAAIYLEPPIAILTAYFWLDEIPSLTAIVGGVVIIFGVWLGNKTTTAT